MKLSKKIARKTSQTASGCKFKFKFSRAWVDRAIDWGYIREDFGGILSVAHATRRGH